MASRKRRGVIVASVLAGWAVCQCFTLSMPSVFRVVDARTQRPLSNVWAFALWKSYSITLAGANPGPHLMGRAARSDAEGWVHLPMAFTLHRPMAPLSFYARDWGYFPQLLLISPGHAPRLESTSWDWPYPTVLFGTPPIAAPVHLRGSVELEPPGPPQGPRSFGAQVINDALASTSAVLSQRQRCEFTAPAFAALKEIYGASAPEPQERRDAFMHELAACP